MTYQVLTELKVKTRQGEAILKTGSMIRLDPAKATPLIESRKIKHVESAKIPLPEDRQTPIAPKEIGESGATVGAIWRNPYPQGTLEARQTSLEVVIEAMLYGLPPVDDEQTRQINDMARYVLSGKAKLAEFRRLLGLLH